ncbi:hypothetical protein IP84_01325 [beta proteobacterium AAP99]|nr:hypothetical protein IP84_01325 [beta proteobacterium AAP99]
MKGQPAMSDSEVAAMLTSVPGWAVKDGAIEKTFSFANYHETLAFVNALAYVVHLDDHHPDLMVSYNRCVVRLNTHDVNGLSMNDFIVAAKANALYAQR